MGSKIQVRDELTAVPASILLTSLSPSRLVIGDSSGMLTL